MSNLDPSLFEYHDSDRQDYHKYDVDILDVQEPIDLFSNWFKVFKKSCSDSFNACSITTISSDLKPHTRMVLLNSFSDQGFIFYTNYESRKGKDLSFKSYAQLLFFFKNQQRAVHIWGAVEKVSRVDSECYFNSRPLQSRLAAMVSKQSQFLKDRKQLESEFECIKNEYQSKEIVCPTNWGGYRLIPDSYEFWQGRPSRLHDRVIYEKAKSNSWIKQRLYP